MILKYRGCYWILAKESRRRDGIKKRRNWNKKAGRGKRISDIGAANKNAARYAKDYSATTRRTAWTAAKKPTANTTVYAVYVEPAAAITGYVSFDWEAGSQGKALTFFIATFLFQLLHYCNYFSLVSDIILHSTVLLTPFLLEWWLIVELSLS